MSLKTKFMIKWAILPLSVIFFSLPLLGQTSGANSWQHAQIGDTDWVEFPFRPGDGLFINVFPDSGSFLNGTFSIDDRGFVELPILGKVNIAKMKREDLIAFLQDNYKSYLRFPNIYVKPLARVSVLGGFVRPGLYYIDINNSIWDVVHLAGGTILEDGIYDMKWERSHEEKTDDLIPFFEQGMSLKRMGFRSGDQFWTPSPTRRTIWDTVRDVLPILTFTTTIWMLYNTYQRDTVLLQRR